VPYVPGTHSQARCGAPPVAAPPGPRAAHGRLSAWDPDARAHDARGSQLALQDGSGLMALRAALEEKPVLPLCGCCAGRPEPRRAALASGAGARQAAAGRRFGHLVGYGGMYYAYLYATALAATMWRAHFDADPFSRAAGAPRAPSPAGASSHARRAPLPACVAVIGIGSVLLQKHVGTAPCTSCPACCALTSPKASLPACGGRGAAQPAVQAAGSAASPPLRQQGGRGGATRGTTRAQASTCGRRC